jgi:hypothetical protein
MVIRRKDTIILVEPKEDGRIHIKRQRWNNKSMKYTNSKLGLITQKEAVYIERWH